ncbi:TPA_asm: maturation protein [ssRNA phage SRR5467091_2]|uniref:Maturation protein n=1 Tax=ssRNA phage SRR5467091_2 TaxID=2786467 RepID=A0A8S5L583_9VIRU|nr:maturation protein [ssRNA phage SRR5467091_2]DAD52501.1 TPA_asm: maturation protein [ssRNA phage SRR5467091_2]
MNTKTKTDLGRISFEASVARKSSPGYGGNGSGRVVQTFSRPGGVQYAPYAVPGFRQKIKRVEDATSVLIGTKASTTAVIASQYSARSFTNYDTAGRYTDLVASGQLFASFWYPPTGAPATNPLAQALAAEKFLADYYAKTRSIEGSSVLAEATGAIRGLASPAKALRQEVGNLYHSLRGRLYRNRKAALRDARRVAAGTWLEWNFDKKPLIDDVNGAADAVNKMRDGDFRVTQPVRGVGHTLAIGSYDANQGVSSVIPPGPPISGNIGVVDRYVRDETLTIIRGVVFVGSPAGEIPAAMQWGLTAEDLGPGFLEAIPWSWMADYFVNITSVIQAWSVLQSRIGWCNRTIRNRRSHVISDLRPNPDSSWGATWTRNSASGGACEASFTSVLRSPVAWTDVAPSLRLRLPGVTSTKWANLGAVSQYYRDAKEFDAKYFHLRRRDGRPRRARW